MLELGLHHRISALVPGLLAASAVPPEHRNGSHDCPQCTIPFSTVQSWVGMGGAVSNLTLLIEG